MNESYFSKIVHVIWYLDQSTKISGDFGSEPQIDMDDVKTHFVRTTGIYEKETPTELTLDTGWLSFGNSYSCFWLNYSFPDVINDTRGNHGLFHLYLPKRLRKDITNNRQDKIKAAIKNHIQKLVENSNLTLNVEKIIEEANKICQSESAFVERARELGQDFREEIDNKLFFIFFEVLNLKKDELNPFFESLFNELQEKRPEVLEDLDFYFQRLHKYLEPIYKENIINTEHIQTARAALNVLDSHIAFAVVDKFLIYLETEKSDVISFTPQKRQEWSRKIEDILSKSN